MFRFYNTGPLSLNQNIRVAVNITLTLATIIVFMPRILVLPTIIIERLGSSLPSFSAGVLEKYVNSLLFGPGSDTPILSKIDFQVTLQQVQPEQKLQELQFIHPKTVYASSLAHIQ